MSGFLESLTLPFRLGRLTASALTRKARWTRNEEPVPGSRFHGEELSSSLALVTSALTGLVYRGNRPSPGKARKRLRLRRAHKWTRARPPLPEFRAEDSSPSPMSDGSSLSASRVDRRCDEKLELPSAALRRGRRPTNAAHTDSLQLLARDAVLVAVVGGGGQRYLRIPPSTNGAADKCVAGRKRPCAVRRLVIALVPRQAAPPRPGPPHRAKPGRSLFHGPTLPTRG